MDPLSDIIALLRPSAAISKPISGRGRWAVRYAAHAAPGFTIILKGECWVEFDAEPPLQLREGDFLLLPATPAFTLGSEPGLPGLPGLPHEPVATAVRHGEPTGEADFEALGGSFHIRQANAPLLLALLPRHVHIPAADGRAHRLGRVIELIRDECARDEPGRELLLQRLLEVLLIEALRRRATGGDAATAGLLAGLRDPMLARALAAMHRDVGAGWTVAGLARLAAAGAVSAQDYADLTADGRALQHAHGQQQQRRQERARIHLRAWPFADPQHGVVGGVGAQPGPGLVDRDRPGGGEGLAELSVAFEGGDRRQRLVDGAVAAGAV